MDQVYWKQAIGMLKENKLLSGISILGTALAISMIMVMVITYQIRVKNYPPETKRDRMLYVRWAGRSQEGKPYGQGYLSLKTIKECLLPLNTPEAVSIVSPWRPQLVSLPGGKAKKVCLLLYTDDVFWKIFDFRFISGGAYGREDAVVSGLKKAVVSESVARRLYGTSDVIGKTILIGYKSYTICGVVKDVSTIARASYAEIWIPYTANLFPDDDWAENSTGWYQTIILARSADDFGAIRQELDRELARYNAALNSYELTFYDQPDTQLDWEIKGAYALGPDKTTTILRYVSVVGILLLVPAINLSGLTLSQMRKRMSEIGVRKAFGATRVRLLVQILAENMFLTSIGGLLGLFVSYIALFLMRTWLLGNSFASIYSVFGGTPAIQMSVLFNPAVFVYAFLFCLLLNLLSAGVPAFRLSGKNVIDALREN